jgi:hypothetical protein
MRWISKFRPSPAMIVAVIAVVISMSGVSYAAIKIGARNIKNGAVTTKKIRNNTIRSKDVHNKTLLFRDVACPRGTRRFETACFETGLRGPSNFSEASNSCGNDRRLPTASELLAFRNENGITLANPEMSSNVFREGNFRYITVDDNGNLGRTLVNNTRQYRCVAPMKG